MADKNKGALPVFGRRLRAMRRAMGVKQQVLAADIGVDQTSVSRWESGRQIPSEDVQAKALAAVSPPQFNDFTLRRLIESSRDCVHLVEETSHICLAYSQARAKEWRCSQKSMLGVSLWQFATDEIREAEHGLEYTDWWGTQAPEPKHFYTSGKKYDEITLRAGGLLWERLYLSDGTPVRLCTYT